MRKVVTKGSNEVRIVKTLLPSIGRRSVLIKTTYSLISTGTELEYISLDLSDDQPLGYCAAGVIIDIGKDVCKFKIGDNVIAMGWNYAIHSEYISVPYKLVLEIPSHIDYKSAIYACLGATIEHAISRSGLAHEGGNALIVGVGIVGQLLCRRLRSLNVPVFICDPIDYRRKIALCMKKYRSIKEVVEDTEYRYNYIFFCTGSNVNVDIDEIYPLFSTSCDGSKKCNIVMVGRGEVSGKLSPALGNINIIVSSHCGAGYRDEDYIMGYKDIVPSPEGKTVDENIRCALNVIANGAVDIEGLTTHAYKFSNILDAYNMLKSESRHLGVLISYN